MSSQWPPQQMPPQPGLPPDLQYGYTGQLPPQQAMGPGMQQATMPQQPPGSPIRMPQPGGTPQLGPPMQPGQPGQPPMAGRYQADPNLVKAMLMGQEHAPEEAAMQRQQMLADKLRADAPGLMRSQSPINTPNWAGAIAGAAQGIKAGRMEDAAQARLKEIGGERKATLMDFFNKLDQPRV